MHGLYYRRRKERKLCRRNDATVSDCKPARSAGILIAVVLVTGPCVSIDSSSVMPLLPLQAGIPCAGLSGAALFPKGKEKDGWGEN